MNETALDKTAAGAAGVKREESRRDVHLERYHPSYETRLLEFYRANLKEAARFERYWHWRKRAPAGNGTEEVVLALYNGVITGALGAVGIPLSFSGRRIRASWQQDSLVSPSMRGKGVGRALVEHARQGWELAMAKGTSRAMYGLRKSGGFRDVGNSNYLVKVLVPDLRSGDARRRIAAALVFLWGKAFSERASVDSVPVAATDHFDPSFDRLAERLARENVIRPLKSAAYLNWRYRECPGRDYVFLRAGREEARGTAALGIVGTGGANGWIVDLVCGRKDHECRRSLLGAAMRVLRQRRVRRVWAFATLPEARRSLLKLGFVPTRMTPRFTYREPEGGLHDVPLADGSWDFWHGDGDVELYD